MSALVEMDWPAFHTTENDRKDWAPEYEPYKKRPLLDSKTEPHPILNLLMDEALRGILMTADGAVAALKERTTGSKPGTITPTSALAGTLDELGERYMRCRTHRARLVIIKEAQTTLDRLKYAPRAEQRGTPEWKQAIGTDERSCRVIANVYRVSLREVVSYRKSYR